MLDEAFDLPDFRDPDGGVWVWDSESHSYTKKPSAGLEQDRGHATGGDNDLFNQNQIEHSELEGVPELEGYMAAFEPRVIPGGGEGSSFGIGDYVTGAPGSRREGMRGYIVTHDPAEPGWEYGVQWYPTDSDVEHRPATDLLPYGYGAPHSAHKSEWAPDGRVKCPMCSEITDQPACPDCGKDLTPEWNSESDGGNDEFFGIHPEFDAHNEFTSDPERVPKRNREKTDDSYPSMSLSKTYEITQKLAARKLSEDDWNDFFAGGGSKVEIGKWLLDRNGAFHFDHGMNALHEKIAERDGIRYPEDVATLGSVYNDGSADVQRVFPGARFDQESIQSQITQAFGPVTLQGPAQQAQQKPVGFQPIEITGGQWVIPPQLQNNFITGAAWVKDQSPGPYNAQDILVAEHLQPEDYELWQGGVKAIITATGGLSSHAAYLATTEGIPVIVGIGAPYSKIESGNYLKIDPGSKVVTVMPGANPSMSPDQKRQVSDSYVDYQMQRGGSLTTQFGESPDWIKISTATLDNCPECSDVMHDRDGESVCHGCGHKQPIIVHEAAVLAPLGEAAIGGLAGGAEAGGAAGAAGGLAGGGGLSGIGGLMQKALSPGALQQGYYADKLLGGGGDAGQQPGGPQTVEDTSSMQGVLANVRACPECGSAMKKGSVGAQCSKCGFELGRAEEHTAGVWGDIIEHLVNTLGKTGEAFTDPKNPLSYIDDVAGLAGGSGQQQYQSSVEIEEDEAWGLHTADTFGEEEVGSATKNRGENSDPEHDGSGASFEEKGDSPELLKDVDGPGDAKGDAFPEDDLKNQGDPALQEKALKSLHMNLPLVIEFSNSDEAGSENPILLALDQLLEEAFPGYKDGHDPASEQKEHPADEDTSEDESGEKPDDGDSSDGEESPKSDPKEASVWHFAMPLEDYAHHNEDAQRIWWEEEGKHPHEPDYGDPYDDDRQYGAEDAHYEGIYEQMQEMGPDDLQAVISAPENFFEGDPKHIVEMAQEALSNHQYHQERLQDTGPTGLAGLEQPTAKTANAPFMPGMPAPTPGAAQMTAPVCPMCGQTHVPGTACPTPTGNQIQQPAATGAPITPAQPNTVVTKWEVVAFGEPQCPHCRGNLHNGVCVQCGMPAEAQPQDAQLPMAPPPVSPQQYVAAVDDEFAFYAASEEKHEEHTVEHKQDDDSSDGDDHDIDASSDNPWVDDTGAPITAGVDYEMKANSYAIPDRVTIDRVLPDKITYTLHSGDVDYQDEVTKEQLDLDGISFTALGGEAPFDSSDGFQDYEAPVRPGQDATPQVDDISSPDTVVSSTNEFEPISLETYTGSYRGDAPDDRSWLMEDSSPVAVDPALMAKFAGKDYSPRQQREFIDESGEARNLDRLDLEGTHYVMNDVDAHFNW